MPLKPVFSASAIQLTGLILLGFTLRLFGLARQSLWFDEIIIISLAMLPPLAGLQGLLQQGIQPTPADHWVIKLWLALLGHTPLPTPTTEWLARFPTGCWGMLIIPVMFQLGRQLFNRSVGWLAAALVAVNPFLIWYAQEARGYSLLAWPLPAQWRHLWPCCGVRGGGRRWR
jgi:uncharacterized membrane protein